MTTEDEEKGWATPELATRRAIIQLVRGPYIDSQRHGELWLAVRHNKDLVERYLGGLCLDLVIDEEWGFAFVRENEEARESGVSVVKRMRLSLLETFLLIHLRKLVTESSGTGQRVVVSHEELRDYLQSYAPARTTDHAGYERKSSAAIAKLVAKHLLNPVGRDSIALPLRRYEVTPIIKLIFGADQIQALAETFERMAAGTWTGNAQDDEADDDEEGDDAD